MPTPHPEMTIRNVGNYPVGVMLEEVFLRLLNQGTFAIADNFHCRYRTESGSMCAVGGLLPDEDYDSRHEGYGARQLVDALEISMPEPHLLALEVAQSVHDNAAREEPADMLTGLLVETRRCTNEVEDRWSSSNRLVRDVIRQIAASRKQG